MMCILGSEVELANDVHASIMPVLFGRLFVESSLTVTHTYILWLYKSCIGFLPTLSGAALEISVPAWLLITQR